MCILDWRKTTTQRRRAGERVIVHLEAAFKDAFLPKKAGYGQSKMAHGPHAHELRSEDTHEQNPPVLKYRKSQRFYHCKVPRNLVYVGKLLERLLKHTIWATLSERLDSQDARNVSNPMDLTIVRANLELGLYASSDMCLADIRLALHNARAVYAHRGAASLDVQKEAHDLSLMIDAFEQEVLVGKMNVMAYGYGETRQDVPLSTGALVQVTRDLVDRSIDRPDAGPFLEPVRPIEDGCAGMLHACTPACTPHAYLAIAA